MVDQARRQSGSADDSPWFTLSRSGELAFPSDKIFFSDFQEGGTPEGDFSFAGG